MFLYNLLISPFETLIDWVYIFISGCFGLLGTFGTIYFVSVAVNLLALPLYNKADEIQNNEKIIIKKLESGVSRIKKAFRGNERFLMLQEYYKQNNYHPLYTLRGSLSILIEIPLFIAAYHYLSTALQSNTDTWWIFKSFSSPDKLLSFSMFGRLITINILPLVMTLVNYVSGFIYTRKSSLRDKIQVYALGLVFLVLLYNSPSGLVLYWILNNVFSLGKNITQKTKYRGQILGCYIGLHFVAFGVLSIMFLYSKGINVVIIILGCLIILHSILTCINNYRENQSAFLNKAKIKLSIIDMNTLDSANVRKRLLLLLLTSGCGCAIVLGLLLPANTIATSPIEFSYIGNTSSPLSYIWTSLFVFIGTFVIWPYLIYKMFGNKTKFYETMIVFAMFIFSVLNAFIFKSDYGKVSMLFQVQDGVSLLHVGLINHIFAILSVFVVLVLMFIIVKKRKTMFLVYLCISISLASLGVSIYKLVYIHNRFKAIPGDIKDNAELNTMKELEPRFTLSAFNKNFVVFFLDTAINPFLPYVMEDFPELKKQYDGFVYYPNTVSYSAGTVTGTPPMLGGYEYTPHNINKRSDEFLVDKHNEALSVLPTLFTEAGYEATLTDMPWVNYSARGDLAVLNALPNTKSFDLYGEYADRYIAEKNYDPTSGVDNSIRKEIRNFSVIQTIFPIFRDYFNAHFRRINVNAEEMVFINNFSELYYLRDISEVKNTSGQLIVIGNNTTHDPVFLDDSYTIPMAQKEGAASTPFDNKDTQTIIRYQMLVASLKQIGLWLDYLRENNVYDNTRIVIVADHGAWSTFNDDIRFPKTSFMPLLMFKDFNSNESVKTDNTFMTNADVLFLLKLDEDNISNINPFTYEEFKQDKESGVETVVTYETNAETLKIRKAKQYHFEKNSYGKKIKNGSLYDPSNWE